MRSRLGQAASRVLIAFLVALTMLLIAAPCTHAQRQGQVAFGAGVATDQRGAQSNAVTVSPSLAFESERGVSSALGAHWTQYTGDVWALGGWGALSQRSQFAGPLAVTLDGSASASRLDAQRAWATFAAAQIVPGAALVVGPLELFVGAQLAAGRVAQRVDRPLIPGLGVGRGGSSTVAVTRSGVGPTFGVDFLTLAAPGAVFRVGAREDRIRIDGLTIADQTLSAALTKYDAMVSGHVGRRNAPDERAEYGGAALRLGITRGGDVALNVAAGRYPSDRLSGALAGKYFNAGLSFGFGNTLAGRGVTRVPGPSARGAPTIPPGYTRLTIDAPGASMVEVAGDFNQWMPVAAHRATNGVWYADLRIQPGMYRYAFRLNGKDWRVPRGAAAVNDGFGGKSAWLTVRSSGG